MSALVHLALCEWFLGEALVQQGPHTGGLVSLPVCACRGRVSSVKVEMARLFGVHTMPSCDVLVSSPSLHIAQLCTPNSRYPGLGSFSVLVVTLVFGSPALCNDFEFVLAKA